MDTKIEQLEKRIEELEKKMASQTSLIDTFSNMMIFKKKVQFKAEVTDANGSVVIN